MYFKKESIKSESLEVNKIQIEPYILDGLITSYLQFFAYEETLSAFTKESGFKNKLINEEKENENEKLISKKHDLL